mmetsp:Transcript_49297/g.151631  ORF Transcript_49297/g.151631 Transcript_49297/m.151631 type:complete len:263 (-) Transcript_49297:327-1115(-)
MPPPPMPPMHMPPMHMPPMHMPPMAPMVMSFGAATSGVPFLFSSWKPATPAAFFFACALTMAAAAALEVALRALPHLERRLARGGRRLAHRNLLRAAHTVATTGLSYALMLLAMSFNVYIFAAVILGFGLGALFAGHLHEPPKTRPPRLAEMDSANPPTCEQLSVLRVSGMTCAACVVAVEVALRSVAGVTAAAVDLEAGSATVLSSSGGGGGLSAPPITQMLDAVEKTGRTASAVVVGAAFGPSLGHEPVGMPTGRAACCR